MAARMRSDGAEKMGGGKEGNEGQRRRNGRAERGGNIRVTQAFV